MLIGRKRKSNITREIPRENDPYFTRLKSHETGFRSHFKTSVWGISSLLFNIILNIAFLSSRLISSVLTVVLAYVASSLLVSCISVPLPPPRSPLAFHHHSSLARLVLVMSYSRLFTRCRFLTLFSLYLSLYWEWDCNLALQLLLTYNFD